MAHSTGSTRRSLWTAANLLKSETRRAVWIAAVLLCLIAPAQAQFGETFEDVDTPGLVIEAVAGWDGTVDQSAPIPISLLIANYSERMIEGQLRLSDPFTGRDVLLGEVVINPGAKRRYAYIQSLVDWHRCDASLVEGDEVLWRRELALNTGNQFFPNVNYVLFVDAGGRSLQIPGAISDTAAIAATTARGSTDGLVADQQGRPVRVLSVKPWHVPNHPGPMEILQALVLPEGAKLADMNRVQWQAVADWICLGGTLFVHKDSDKIISRLVESAPLSADPPVSSEDFTVRRIGLGAIYEYQPNLFAASGSETRQRIGEVAAKLKKQFVRSLIDSDRLHRWGGKANVNGILILSFFGLYALFSGVVALALFRQSQRRIAAYTLIVVVAASILSAFIGGLLRISRGDLNWITVTEIGPGGAVQVGKISVQSAGGRNTEVAVHGKEADMQVTGRSRYYHPIYTSTTICPPFNWQPNLAPGEEDGYQVRVGMTPWGRRQLRATAFDPELPLLDFDLQYEPQMRFDNTPQPRRGIQNVNAGMCSLKISNQLPFEIIEGWLVIAATYKPPGQPTSNQGNQVRFRGSSATSMPVVAANNNGLVDVVHIQKLPKIDAGDDYQTTFRAVFRNASDFWSFSQQLPRGWVWHPRLSRLGTEGAWFIGRVEKSPNLSIDEQNSDFSTLEERHYIVQEIPPEDMPSIKLFAESDTQEAKESSEEPAP